MYYKLSSQYALRSWKKIGTVLLNLDSKIIDGLDFLSFIALSRCDGLTECDADDQTLKYYESKKIIAECEKGDEINEEQKFRSYPNEYFPIVQWAITNRCNYLCKHCFMASSMDNETAEPAYEQCMELIEQFAECGIPVIYLTGGETLVRKDFLSIIDKLIEKNIHISIISTNGALVNENLLTEIKKRNIKPTFVVSFDGIGCHDWLRGVKGAEEASIRAIKLIIEHGFNVITEMAVHKGNVHTVIETGSLMNALGVSTFKTIRVAESPRWKETGKDSNLTPEQYYDKALELLKVHIEQNWKMDMKLIGFLFYYYSTEMCDILPMKGLSSDSDKTILCKKARSILFVSGDGRLLPCNPFNGITAGREDWGNVFDTPLQNLLTESAYLEKVNATVSSLKDRNENCRKCEWLKYCIGGCRACAYAETEDYWGADSTKCKFFKGGYAEKIRAIAGAEKCTLDF